METEFAVVIHAENVCFRLNVFQLLWDVFNYKMLIVGYEVVEKQYTWIGNDLSKEHNIEKFITICIHYYTHIHVHIPLLLTFVKTIVPNLCYYVTRKCCQWRYEWEVEVIQNITIRLRGKLKLWFSLESEGQNKKKLVGFKSRSFLQYHLFEFFRIEFYRICKICRKLILFIFIFKIN